MKNQSAASNGKVAKFFRLDKILIDQLEQAADLSGIDQQQIMGDALALYFNPAEPSALAQREALHTRIRLARDAASGTPPSGAQPEHLAKLKQSFAGLRLRHPARPR